MSLWLCYYIECDVCINVCVCGAKCQECSVGIKIARMHSTVSVMCLEACAQPGTEAVVCVTALWMRRLTRDITQYDRGKRRHRPRPSGPDLCCLLYVYCIPIPGSILILFLWYCSTAKWCTVFA